jgi:hypothetical protein
VVHLPGLLLHCLLTPWQMMGRKADAHQPAYAPLATLAPCAASLEQEHNAIVDASLLILQEPHNTSSSTRTDVSNGSQQLTCAQLAFLRT